MEITGLQWGWVINLNLQLPRTDRWGDYLFTNKVQVHEYVEQGNYFQMIISLNVAAQIIAMCVALVQNLTKLNFDPTRVQSAEMYIERIDGRRNLWQYKVILCNILFSCVMTFGSNARHYPEDIFMPFCTDMIIKHTQTCDPSVKGILQDRKLTEALWWTGGEGQGLGKIHEEGCVGKNGRQTNQQMWRCMPCHVNKSEQN